MLMILLAPFALLSAQTNSTTVACNMHLMRYTTHEQGAYHFHSTANCQVRTDPLTLLVVC
jgi:hypothetical protein